MSNSKKYLKKVTPYIFALVTGIIVFVIGIKIVNSGFVMNTLTYIPTRICFITSRILTLDFRSSDLGTSYLQYPFCKVVYNSINVFRPFINFFLRLGAVVIGIGLGGGVYDVTKKYMSKK